MISRKDYHKAVEIFEKSEDATYSLSMKTSSYNQIFTNKFYFAYTIIKLIFLEILFFPISIKDYLLFMEI